MSRGHGNPAFGGANRPIGYVEAFARCTTSRFTPRLAEWTDLIPSNGSVPMKNALAGSDILLVL